MLPPEAERSQTRSDSHGGRRNSAPRGLLADAGSPTVAVIAVAAAFTAYFAMYAFRKPFTAATFAGLELGGYELKGLFVVAQLLGYATSKFLGIRVVSEASPARRAWMLLGFVGFAELALVAFALVPGPWKLLALFCNGLPLGMVWGLVFSFLEGRRTTEILGAGLSMSYIVASGAVKSVGAALLDRGVSETSMPALTGLLFAPVFALAVGVLASLPAPDHEDEAARTRRAPMDGAARTGFFRSFAPGLVALTSIYVALTALRDFRDNFAREILGELGVEQGSVFVRTEAWVAFLVMLCLAAIWRIRDNRAAFFAIHGLMAAGAAIIALATLALELGLISPVTWMIALGTGLYLAYVPYGCVLFDRLIAASGIVATAVFMIYVTDAFGYVGSVAIVLLKTFFAPKLAWFAFFRTFAYVTATVCLIGFATSAWYFARTLPIRRD